MSEFVVTARVCQSNAEQFPDILRLYVPPPAKVLDMTYGNGVFWKQVEGKYNVTKNDIDPDRGDTHHDFTALPSRWRERFDCVILDPPFLLTGGWKTLKTSIDRGYQNRARSSRGISGAAKVMQMYAGAMIEAHRVLGNKGILVCKTMDQVESGKQQWMSMRLLTIGDLLGFDSVDWFIMVNANIPTMRHERQVHARRNHSHWLVFRKRNR